MKSKLVQNTLKLYYYTKREGVAALIRRGIRAAVPLHGGYERWKKKHRISRRELERQSREGRRWDFSIDIALSDHRHYPMLKKSLERQSVKPGEVIYDLKDGKGEFILLAGSDIYLSANAIYECGRYIQENPLTDWFYSDHDVMGKAPLFKPDFNRYYLRSCPYIGDVIVVRRKMMERFLKTKQKKPFGNIYGLQLRLSDFSCHIGHISKILYHTKASWPVVGDIEKNKNQLMAYLADQSMAWTVNDGMAQGTYDVRYALSKRPLISVVIPSQNHLEDLKKCIDSLLNQSYKTLEILIMENNSTDPEVFEFYKNIEKNHANVRVMEWNYPFNYSAINNFALDHVRGNYVLFLNNDVEFLDENSILRMIELGVQPKVGAVGMKLLYPEGTVQHAGVIVGYGGIAGHAFLGASGNDHGYMHRIDCVQNYSAVTAACMLVKRDTLLACDGFDERFQIAFNDIDLCLRLQAQGFETVYTPYACARHYESRSRGKEDTFEKMRRFNREVDLFCSRWKSVIKDGDKAYNPNLSLEKWDFSIKL